MEDLVLLRIFSTLRLLFAGYLMFFWIPRRILPQEYLEDRLDGVMFNIIHMTAIFTILFPLFVYLRFFGFPFLVIFFFCVRLIFLKFWYKRELGRYLKDDVYHRAVISILELLEDFKSFIDSFRKRRERLLQAVRGWATPLNSCSLALVLLVAGYGIYIRMLGPYSSLLAAISDMYQYFYWNQILKLNILFDRIAGAPYPWGAPLLVYTVNLLAQLNTVVLYNSFPLLVLSFAFFTLFYIVRRVLPGNVNGASSSIALILFGIVIPSPSSQRFFGTVFSTDFPHISSLGLLSVYSGGPAIGDSILDTYPFIFFIRYTHLLPYETAAGFFLLNLFFLHRALTTRKGLYILLFAETLAIMSAIHPGVLIPLFIPALLITLYDTILSGTDLKTIKRGAVALSAALIAGNVWLVQFLIYGLPQDIGAAAPILDRIFGTSRGVKETAIDVNRSVQIVEPTILLGLLFTASILVLGFSLLRRDRKEWDSLTLIPLTSIGILFLYYAPNLGLPRIVDQSRMQPFVALSYSLTAAGSYGIFVETGLLRRIFAERFKAASLLTVFIVALSALFLTPRWIDNPYYWQQARKMELVESPYFIYKIEDAFQPFTYTVVSYVEDFSKVYSLGYHMNTHDLLTSFSPLDKTLKIPTDYVFIFVENSPVTYQGLGQFWYRWRGDIMLKLKDWIAIYGVNHGNIKIWAETERLQVYLIDNRSQERTAARKWKELTGKER
jgi:hypothetical protein